MEPRIWTCKRSSHGDVCGQINPRRKQICAKCGKRRPPTKRPAHMKALDEMPYEKCVELFGEVCGICGKPPKPGKKLHRDHDHKGDGYVRGLLCFGCNTGLPNRVTIEWLENAAYYLEQAQERQRSIELYEIVAIRSARGDVRGARPQDKGLALDRLHRESAPLRSR